LSLIASEWESAYNELRSVVSLRHCVEIAFAAAAERVGIQAEPCPKTIQGNFASGPPGGCWVFHYGGDTEESRELKAALGSKAALMTSTGMMSPNALASVKKTLIAVLGESSRPENSDSQ
jgi:hypothetical protein